MIKNCELCNKKFGYSDFYKHVYEYHLDGNAQKVFNKISKRIPKSFRFLNNTALDNIYRKLVKEQIKEMKE